MTRENKISKLSLILVFILGVILIPKTFDVKDVLHASTYSSFEIDSTLLREGDIIFRRGISLVSNIVLETDSQSPYSHVGIVVFDSKKPYVVHAVPEESENDIDYVRKDPLDLFLRKDRASAFAVYRYFDSTAAHAASLISSRYHNSKILFDAAFNLFDSKELYCTELIWRAYKEVNVDITNNVFDTLTIPLGSNPYLLPGTLLRSEHLSKIIKSSIYQ